MIELKTPSVFIAWEANLNFCRERITVAEDCERGDLLIHESGGFKPYKGEKLTVEEASSVLAVALESAKASEKVPAIVRGAVILYDQLNHTKADDATNQKPCEKFKDYANAQQLVFINSIDPDWSK